jgi:hypothetical protein
MRPLGRVGIHRVSRDFGQTLKGAVVLAGKFVVDLANIDILAAIASCLPTKTPTRPGHVLIANTP